MLKARLYFGVVALCLSGLVLGSCARVEEVEIRLAPIHEVKVNIAESYPPQVFAYIKGGLNDACTTFHQLTVERSGNTIYIEVATQRPKGAICAQVYGFFEQNVNLGSDFTSGETYIVKVNDMATSFVMQPQQASVEVSCDDFYQQQHISKEVEVAVGGTVTVTLCSNPTTGFIWSERAQISDQSVLQQTSHRLVMPESEPPPPPGTPGQEVWTFQALNKGTSTVSVEYSRPWEGGEKGEWTFVLTVTVK